MIVRCEKCGKKYRIDETKIVGKKIRIKCKHCQNMLDITKPKSVKKKLYSSENLDSLAPTTDIEPEDMISPRRKSPAKSYLKDTFGKTPSGFQGLTIAKKIFLICLGSVIIMGSALVYVYLQYVPSLLSEQTAIRTLCISRSLSAAVAHPLLVRDYLLINQMAETNSKLPGVAYVSVVNKKGMIVAGIFNDLEQFSPAFVSNVKQQGFPRELPLKNFIPQGKNKSSKDFLIGGQRIHDVAISIGDTGGVIHVGTFIEKTGKVFLKSIKPLIINLAILIILGTLSFLIVAKFITRPIRKLANEARRASVGEISHPIAVKGDGEIEVLSDALEKIRLSLQSDSNY